jgi:hypothetical protein
MKGDISRSTFNKTRHFSKVRSEQGRVSIDADWNEEVDIQSYHNITSLLDIIGYAGTSDTNAFKITGNGPTYSIGKGRYYIGGLVAENDEDIQDGEKWQRENGDLPPLEGVLPPTDPKVSLIRPTKDGYYIAYLEVWERELTALEDPEIKEPALGGPDTSTRVKTVWQVKFLYAGKDFSKILVSAAGTDNSLSSKLPTFKQLEEFVNVERARLTARAVPMERRDDICVLPSTTKYTGLENQLYRAEIHKPGIAGTATFKVARNNATIAAKITSIESNTMIKVSSTGKDAHLGFVRDKLAEITDERRELWGLPGIMVRLTNVDPSNSQITFTEIDGSFRKEDFPLDFNPKIRMWDYYQPVRVPAENGGFLEIEHGIQIKFEASETYQTEDCWLIPARSFLLDRASDSFDQSMTGDILWPRQADGHESPVPSIRAVHHVWPLALLEFKSGLFISSPNYRDFRRIFPLLTDLVSFQYVGGDGQSTGPGQVLPVPLMVGISRGEKPVSDVSVTFAIRQGNGLLFEKGDPSLPETENERGKSLTIHTDENGLAVCHFQLDDGSPTHLVEAFMLDVFGARVPLPPVRFNASLTLDSPSLGLHARSGTIFESITPESHKILGPFLHRANEISKSIVPPGIILGQVTTMGSGPDIHEKIRQKDDLADILLLNSRFGVTKPSEIKDEIKEDIKQSGLAQILSDRGDEDIPIFFKPILIDDKKFHVLAINYNKKPTHTVWSDWLHIEREAKLENLVVGRNKDGRLEIFAKQKDGQVAHLAQLSNGNWGSWSPLSGLQANPVFVAEHENGRLEVFAIDMTGVLHHNTQIAANGDAWSGWSKLGDIKIKHMAVGRNKDGRLEVFAIRDVDSEVWHIEQNQPNGDWKQWASLPTSRIKLQAKQVAVGRNQDGRLEVFAIGAPVKAQITEPAMAVKAGFEVDTPKEYLAFRSMSKDIGDIGIVRGAMRNAEMIGAGIGFVSGFGTVVDEEIISSASIGNRSTLFINAEAGSSFVVADSMKWMLADSAPELMVTLPPSVTFTIETDDDTVWHRWQNEAGENSWSEWETLPGIKASHIAVANNKDGRLEVFALEPKRGSENSYRLQHRHQGVPNARGSTNWTNWVSREGDLTQHIAVTNDEEDRLEVFALVSRSRLVLSSGKALDSNLAIEILAKSGVTNAELVEKTVIDEVFAKSGILTKDEIENNLVTTIDERKLKGLLKMKDVPGFTGQLSVYRIAQAEPDSDKWTGWESLGGGDTQSLSVANNSLNQMVVFAIDKDQDLWTLIQLPYAIPLSLRWWAIPAPSSDSGGGGTIVTPQPEGGGGGTIVTPQPEGGGTIVTPQPEGGGTIDTQPGVSTELCKKIDSQIDVAQDELMKLLITPGAKATVVKAKIEDLRELAQHREQSRCPDLNADTRCPKIQKMKSMLKQGRTANPQLVNIITTLEKTLTREAKELGCSS